MIHMPYEDIIAKIKETSSITDEEISEKVQQKMDQLAGLISKEGAAHILANELGVKLFETGRLKLKNVLPGMRSVEVVGKVQDVYEVREFQRENRTGKVGSFMLADETGRLRVTAWGEKAEELKNLQKDMIVLIQEGYVKDNQGRKEIHLNEKAQLIVQPEGVEVEVSDVPQKQEGTRKYIKDATEQDTHIELFGTIVQVYDPKFFEVCPFCSKRVTKPDAAFICAQHDVVEPKYGYVMNFILDDGTENIRGVCFRRQLEMLTEKTSEELLAMKDSPEQLALLKHDLLGKQVIITGRMSKNTLFERLELVADKVNPNPDPEQEIKRLQGEINQDTPTPAENSE
jgi:replication factor A1